MTLFVKENSMVYTDGVHLTADSLDELYTYATKTGLNPDWIDFRGKNLHPHFDICGRIRQRVLEDINVQKVTCKELVRLCILNFRLPEENSSFDEMETGHKGSRKVEMPSEADFERMIDNIFKKTGLRRS